MDNTNLRDKNKKQEFKNIFNTDYSTARKRLDKKLVFFIAKKLGYHICKCLKEVDPETYTLGHIEPWRKTFSRDGNVDLYWDTNNIRLQCPECNTIDDYTRNESNKWIEGVINFDGFENKKERSNKILQYFARQQLGCDESTARCQLIKKIIFEWGKLANLMVCYHCKEPINKQKDVTLEHIKSWMSIEDKNEKIKLFNDIDNLSFSHSKCNFGAANRGKGESGYNGVQMHNQKSYNYNKWKAAIHLPNGKIKTFFDEKPEVCAEYYDMAILKYKNGEGFINFPEKIEEYKKRIGEGWDEVLICKECGDTHFGKGYCRKHYRSIIEKPKRKERDQLRKTEKENKLS